jgi:DNA-binding response OmpR family regulator
MVDDDPEYADLLKFALGEEGLDVHCAYSGIEALQIARSSVPSVILLDVMLPDIDGLALCEMFNSQAATRDIPIIFLTALSKSWTETRRSKARYIWFLQKPVSLPVLQKLVRTVISESKRTGDPLRNAVSHD